MEDARVNEIVAQVVAQLQRDGLTTSGAARRGPLIQSGPRPSIEGRGIHGSIEQAVEAAQRNFKALQDCSLEARRSFIDAMRAETRALLPQIARDAVSESGLGRVDDKIAKNRLVLEKTPGVEALRPLADSGDHGLTLTEWAPYGVIGSITPCTNPTETILNNGIGMIAAGNSVVFNVHPKAKRLSAFFIDRLNQAIERAGGPPTLLNCIAEPTIASAEALMKHPGIRLLVVTGGGGVVKAAMASGKRAIAAGPGNPPVLVDETADIAQAAKDIVFGASLDNNIICIVEKEIIAVAEIADQLKRSLCESHAVEIRGRDLKRLEKLLITPDNHVNRDFIGKDAALILSEAGISVPASTRLAFAEVEESHPFVQHEMLLPVLGFVRVPDVDEGIRCALRVEHGYGHTAVMHSSDIRALHRYASSANTSIFVKNAPSAAGVGLNGEGFTSWTIASPTGEGMTYAPHFARARRCVLKDAFRIV
ncbi:MAG: aldehyde dehydrogenase family protein [Myxococcota bacterium]|nr:aldehyde dehydrogenase family protein [Myxococcota bacterium]